MLRRRERKHRISTRNSTSGMCHFDLLEWDDLQCVVVCVVVQGQFPPTFVPICKEVHYPPTTSLALLLDWIALWSKEVRKRHQPVSSFKFRITTHTAKHFESSASLCTTTRSHGLVMNHLPIVNEYRKETMRLLNAMLFCPGAGLNSFVSFTYNKSTFPYRPGNLSHIRNNDRSYVEIS